MVPPEILNNLGVLMQKEDKDTEARKFYEEALANCEKLLKQSGSESEGAADKRVQALHLTIRFNLACCHDKASRIGEASEMFKGIIKEQPAYIDAIMRLAYLAKRRGDNKRALEYIEQGKQALNKYDKKVAPTKLFCMKGRFLTDTGNLKEAFGEY